MKTLLTRITIALLYCFSSAALSAQNLVINPGFENTNTICGPNGEQFEADLAGTWDNADNDPTTDSCTTPDLYSACNPSVTSMPNAFLGYQYSHGGTRHAGIILYEGPNSDNYREYLQGRLNSALQAGKVYKVEMYVSRAEQTPYECNNLGVLFSDTLVRRATSPCSALSPLINTAPQLNNSSVISDTTSWQLVSWEYTAAGGEQYFLIGNFYTDAQTTIINTGQPHFFPLAYYYIDDVSIKAFCGNSVTVTTSTTPCVASSGVAMVSTSGSIPYTCLWSTGDTSHTITGLSQGSYTVTVTFNGGCSVQETGTVNNPFQPHVTITANELAICPNDSAELCAPAGYSSYIWNTGETSQCIFAQQPGAFYASVTDNTGCTASSNTIQIDSIGTQNHYFILVNGTTLTILVALPDEQKQWLFNGAVIQGATESTYTATQPGYYSAIVTTTSGCTFVTDEVWVELCSANFNLTPDMNTPHNWFAINQATGIPPLTYTWYWGDGATSTGATPSHTYAASGYYNICLSITDSVGCTAQQCDSSTYIFKAEQAITVNCVTALPTGIDDLTANAVNLYPNPAGNQLFISSSAAINAIDIYNATGQLVKRITQTATVQPIDVSTFSSGLYVAVINVGNTVLKQQWVKL